MSPTFASGWEQVELPFPTRARVFSVLYSVVISCRLVRHVLNSLASTLKVTILWHDSPKTSPDRESFRSRLRICTDLQGTNQTYSVYRIIRRNCGKKGEIPVAIAYLQLKPGLGKQALRTTNRLPFAAELLSFVNILCKWILASSEDLSQLDSTPLSFAQQ